MGNKNIALLCSDAPNQMALAHKLHNTVGIKQLIIESKTHTSKITFARVLSKLRYSAIDKAWQRMMMEYKKKYHAFPAVATLHTSNINSIEVQRTLQHMNPDYVLVSGTRIIKKNIIDFFPPQKIMNLHTGLSPYMNGGPNCTNWCIANNKLHLIGNTIMWLDAGIDSGNIITSQTVDFDGSEGLYEVHLKVMEAAHALYINAAKHAIDDRSQLNNIKQHSVAESTTYYTRMWNNESKRQLLKNFKTFGAVIRSEAYKQKLKELKTFPLKPCVA